MEQKLLVFCYQLNWYSCVISIKSAFIPLKKATLARHGMNEYKSCFPGVLRSLLYFDHLICVCILLSCITWLNLSVLFQPARDATHKMSFTDLNTVLLCLLVVVVVNRWLVLSHLYVCVFCLNKPVSSAQGLLDSSGVYKLAPVFWLHYSFTLSFQMIAGSIIFSFYKLPTITQCESSQWFTRFWTPKIETQEGDYICETD